MQEIAASRPDTTTSSYSQQLLAVSCPNMVKIMNEEEVKKKVAKKHPDPNGSMMSMFSNNASFDSDVDLDCDDQNNLLSSSMKYTARGHSHNAHDPSHINTLLSAEVNTFDNTHTNASCKFVHKALPTIQKPQFTHSLQLQLKGEMSHSTAAMKQPLRKQSQASGMSDTTSEYDVESVYAYSEHMSGITPKATTTFHGVDLNSGRPTGTTGGSMKDREATTSDRVHSVQLPTLRPSSASNVGLHYRIPEGYDMFADATFDESTEGTSLFPSTPFSSDPQAANNHNSSDYAKLQNRTFRNSTARNALHARLHARYSGDTEGDYVRKIRTNEKTIRDAMEDMAVHTHFTQEIKGSLVPKSYI